MPLPTVQVKDGAGAYVGTSAGNNVTPGNTVTIKLIDTSANSWSIACITTDELSVAATVSAALTIDSVLNTATFTAPAAGRAYRFKSIVNGGIGPDGTALPSYSTTFVIYTLLNGERVVAADETTEGDASFGWLSRVNGRLRNNVAKALAADFNSTTATTAQDTALTFAIAANEAWLVEFGGTWSVASGVAGAKLAINGPAATTIEGNAHGELATGLDTYHSARLSALATLSTAFNTVAATPEGVFGSVRVKASSTPGTVTFQVAPGGAVVLTLKAGFWMRATKVLEV